MSAANSYYGVTNAFAYYFHQNYAFPFFVPPRPQFQSASRLQVVTYSRRRSKSMRCPYCNTDYTHDHPCFCHPATQAKPVEEQPASFPETFPGIAWNSHRGVRLD
jgi:hypothetical protein